MFHEKKEKDVGSSCPYGPVRVPTAMNGGDGETVIRCNKFMGEGEVDREEGLT